jgi:steroid delta-isomerase-like uncharacterized protein
MSTEENKTLARRWFAALNADDMHAIGELYASSFTDHIPGQPEPLNIDAFRQFISGFNAAFPDIHHTIEDLVAEGDRVIVRWTARGTNAGSFMGVPPTDKFITVTGVNIYRIAGGKFVEQWTEFDQLGMLQQMGMIPQMA